MVSGAQTDHVQRRCIGRSCPIQVTPDALRGQSQRGKRILDFVRDAPCHLAPRGLLLGAQQIGQVLQHHDVPGALPAIARGLQRRIERSHGDGYVQIDAGSGRLNLAGRAAHAIGFAQHVLQIGNGIWREKIGQRLGRGRRVLIQAQQPAQRGIGMNDASRRVERQHARRNALQNGLDVAAALLLLGVHLRQLAPRSFDAAPAGFQIARPCD